MSRNFRVAAIAALVVAAGFAIPHDAAAFSQSSPITPMGHEWITVASALELLNQPKPSVAQLAKDKGKGILAAVGEWLEKHLHLTHNMSKTKALEQASLRRQFNPTMVKVLTAAHPTDEWPHDGIGGYSARYYNIWSAVMGQRWVDLGGFNVVRSTKCWDAVTQSGEEQQADHFLRRRTQVGPGGAINAIEEARLKFHKYFVEAALADPDDKELITFRDGGAEVGKPHKARKAYFLFGRAAHLFQDSFSAEHGVRDPNTNYKQILDIKSYVCTLGSVGHTHDKPVSGHHGDVIWFHDLAAMGHDYSEANVKPYALAAILAMQDLWTAFLFARTANASHDRTKVAGVLADGLLKRWFSYDRQKVGHTEGQMTAADQPACIAKTAKPDVVITEHANCLKLIAPVGADRDPHLNMPFNWTWAKGGHDEL
jgi:hypothetical protein